MKRMIWGAMATLGVALGLLVGYLTAPVQAQEQAAVAAAAPAEAISIDVTICLDVSGSMNGLINSAKVKLWDIVNDLAKIKPAPNLRVALYSYGHTTYDAQKGWVRKEMDLTVDLDAIYQKLNGLTINGGTEYVARVCRDAIVDQKWSEDKNSLKLIFVCGNEPASQDPTLKLADIAELAKKKGIVINPIFCGNAQHRDAQDWIQFATMAKGQFASIDQDRGIVAIATPQDKELAELSQKLSQTYIAYGKDGKEKQQNQVLQDRNATQAGAPAEAARAATKATALYRNSAWDLVDRLKEDKNFDITKVKDEDLPEELRKLKPEERVKFVKDKLAEREAMQKQIAELNTQRNAFIAEHMKKNPNAADKAFDEAVKKAIKQQAQDRGIKIPE